MGYPRRPGTNLGGFTSFIPVQLFIVVVSSSPIITMKKSELKQLIRECIKEEIDDCYYRRSKNLKMDLLKKARSITIRMKEIAKKEFGV